VQKLDSYMRRIATRATFAHREEPSIATIDIRNSTSSSDDSLSVLRKEIINRRVMMSRLLRH
jgi:hypothetical protein